MTEHTKTDGLCTMDVPLIGLQAERGRAAGKIACNACPVLCQISEGRTAPAPATATPTKAASLCAWTRW